MKLSVGKLARSGIIAEAAGFLAWPYLGSAPAAPDATSEKKDKAPTLAEELLSPAFGTAPERDPFGVEDRVRAALAARAASTARRPGGKGPTAEAVAGRPAPDAKPVPPDPFERLKGLVLEATIIHGARRAALINGKIYKQGDPLAAQGADGLTPLVLERIDRDKVTLASGPGRAELKFTGRGSSSSSSDAPKPVAKAPKPKKPRVPPVFAGGGRRSR
jgi:hypothetical protein